MIWEPRDDMEVGSMRAGGSSRWREPCVKILKQIGDWQLEGLGRRPLCLVHIKPKYGKESQGSFIWDLYPLQGLSLQSLAFIPALQYLWVWSSHTLLTSLPWHCSLLVLWVEFSAPSLLPLHIPVSTSFSHANQLSSSALLPSHICILVRSSMHVQFDFCTEFRSFLGWRVLPQNLTPPPHHG